jgi:DNA-binding transcriptional LysR family regulator
MKNIQPRSDFDLRQLEIFCKVAELKSFSKASKEVTLAQASVSERIATLENMVGARLFDRLGRQVLLTKAGELLYKQALPLLEMKKAICLELDDFQGKEGGEVHIGGSTIPGEYILPELIGQFNKRFPRIFINLSIADTVQIENQVLNGEFEFGVIGSKTSQKNLLIHELWKDELILAIPADHRCAPKKEISVQELSQEPFIIRETGSGTLKIIDHVLQKSSLKGLETLNIVARLGSSTAVKQGIKAGLGISILSSKAVASELKDGSLKALKIKGLAMNRFFYLIRDQRRTLSAPCQALLDFLVSSAQ